MTRDIPTVGASGSVFLDPLGFRNGFPNTQIEMLVEFHYSIKAKYFVIIYGAHWIVNSQELVTRQVIMWLICALGGMLFGYFCWLSIGRKNRHNQSIRKLNKFSISTVVEGPIRWRCSYSIDLQSTELLFNSAKKLFMTLWLLAIKGGDAMIGSWIFHGVFQPMLIS